MFRQSIFRIYENLPNEKKTETQVQKLFYNMDTITSYIIRLCKYIFCS